MSRHRKHHPGDIYRDAKTGQMVKVDPDGVARPWAEPEPYDPWKEIGLDLAGNRDEVEPLPANLPRRADGTIAPFYSLSPDQLERLGQDLPAGRKVRHDGWTLDKQRDFLERLATSASVTDAARSVGMSRQSAREHYNRSPAFRDAWDQALRSAVSVLAETAFDRAVNGVQEQVWYKGRMVGFREKYNDRLLMFLLRVRDPLNFAPLDDLQGWQRFRSVEGRQGSTEALPSPDAGDEEAGQGDPNTPHT